MTVALPIGATIAIETYQDLIDETGNYLNRTDLEARIPTFIQMAESRFNRIIRAPEMETSATATITGDYVLPTDFLEARNVWLGTDPNTVLEQVTPSVLRRYASMSGRPLFYSTQAGRLKFGPTADGSYTLNLEYYAKIPALNEAVPTNWLLDDHADIYLFMTLAHAHLFLNDDDNYMKMIAVADALVSELGDFNNKKRYGAAPQRLRPPVSA